MNFQERFKGKISRLTKNEGFIGILEQQSTNPVEKDHLSQKFQTTQFPPRYQEPQWKINNNLFDEQVIQKSPELKNQTNQMVHRRQLIQENKKKLSNTANLQQNNDPFYSYNPYEDNPLIKNVVSYKAKDEPINNYSKKEAQNLFQNKKKKAPGIPKPQHVQNSSRSLNKMQLKNGEQQQQQSKQQFDNLQQFNEANAALDYQIQMQQQQLNYLLNLQNRQSQIQQPQQPQPQYQQPVNLIPKIPTMQQPQPNYQINQYEQIIPVQQQYALQQQVQQQYPLENYNEFYKYFDQGRIPRSAEEKQKQQQIGNYEQSVQQNDKKKIEVKRNFESESKVHNGYILKDFQKDVPAYSFASRGLGPNTHTEEWEEKKNKIDKIQQYSSNIKLMNMSKRVPLQICESNKIQNEKDLLVKQKYKESKRNKGWEFAKGIKKPVVRKRDFIDESPAKSNEMNQFNQEEEEDEMNLMMEDPMLMQGESELEKLERQHLQYENQVQHLNQYS